MENENGGCASFLILVIFFVIAIIAIKYEPAITIIIWLGMGAYIGDNEEIGGAGCGLAFLFVGGIILSLLECLL